MKMPITIYADFNNADNKGRVRLTSTGTLNDLERKGITLQSGLEVLLDDDEGLATSGIIQFSEEENIWVAQIDWERLK